MSRSCDDDSASQGRGWGILRGVEPDDPELVRRLRSGDRGAFDAVYERYHVRLYAFLLRLAARRDLAGDLFQETWIKLAEHHRELREDSDLAAWLFTVARNAYRSHRRWSVLDLSRFVTSDDALVAIASSAPGPEREVVDAERVALLERALAAVSLSSREALLLVGVEGFDQDQAARIVGVSYAAFRQRLSRARRELASALERIERTKGAKRR